MKNILAAIGFCVVLFAVVCLGGLFQGETRATPQGAAEGSWHPAGASDMLEHRSGFFENLWKNEIRCPTTSYVTPRHAVSDKKTVSRCNCKWMRQHYRRCLGRQGVPPPFFARR